MKNIIVLSKQFVDNFSKEVYSLPKDEDGRLSVEQKKLAKKLISDKIDWLSENNEKFKELLKSARHRNTLESIKASISLMDINVSHIYIVANYGNILETISEYDPMHLWGDLFPNSNFSGMLSHFSIYSRNASIDGEELYIDRSEMHDLLANMFNLKNKKLLRTPDIIRNDFIQFIQNNKGTINNILKEAEQEPENERKQLIVSNLLKNIIPSMDIDALNKAQQQAAISDLQIELTEYYSLFRNVEGVTEDANTLMDILSQGRTQQDKEKLNFIQWLVTSKPPISNQVLANDIFVWASFNNFINNLKNMSNDEVIKKTFLWMRNELEKPPEFIRVYRKGKFSDWDNGEDLNSDKYLKIVNLHSSLALEYEGRNMGHCVGVYHQDPVRNGTEEIYSVRDKNNTSRATISYFPQTYYARSGEGNHIGEIRGFSNGRPPEYVLQTCEKWIKHNNIEPLSTAFKAKNSLISSDDPEFQVLLEDSHNYLQLVLNGVINVDNAKDIYYDTIRNYVGEERFLNHQRLIECIMNKVITKKTHGIIPVAPHDHNDQSNLFDYYISELVRENPIYVETTSNYYGRDTQNKNQQYYLSEFVKKGIIRPGDQWFDLSYNLFKERLLNRDRNDDGVVTQILQSPFNRNSKDYNKYFYELCDSVGAKSKTTMGQLILSGTITRLDNTEDNPNRFFDYIKKAKFSEFRIGFNQYFPEDILSKGIFSRLDFGTKDEATTEYIKLRDGDVPKPLADSIFKNKLMKRDNPYYKGIFNSMVNSNSSFMVSILNGRVSKEDIPLEYLTQDGKELLPEYKLKLTSKILSRDRSGSFTVQLTSETKITKDNPFFDRIVDKLLNKCSDNYVDQAYARLCSIIKNKQISINDKIVEELFKNIVYLTKKENGMMKYNIDEYSKWMNFGETWRSRALNEFISIDGLGIKDKRFQELYNKYIIDGKDTNFIYGMLKGSLIKDLENSYQFDSMDPKSKKVAKSISKLYKSSMDLLKNNFQLDEIYDLLRSGFISSKDENEIYSFLFSSYYKKENGGTEHRSIRTNLFSPSKMLRKTQKEDLEFLIKKLMRSNQLDGVASLLVYGYYKMKKPTIKEAIQFVLNSKRSDLALMLIKPGKLIDPKSEEYKQALSILDQLKVSSPRDYVDLMNRVTLSPKSINKIIDTTLKEENLHTLYLCIRSISFSNKKTFLENFNFQKKIIDRCLEIASTIDKNYLYSNGYRPTTYYIIPLLNTMVYTFYIQYRMKDVIDVLIPPPEQGSTYSDLTITNNPKEHPELFLESLKRIIEVKYEDRSSSLNEMLRQILAYNLQDVPEYKDLLIKGYNLYIERAADPYHSNYIRSLFQEFSVKINAVLPEVFNIIDFNKFVIAFCNLAERTKYTSTYQGRLVVELIGLNIINSTTINKIDDEVKDFLSRSCEEFRELLEKSKPQVQNNLPFDKPELINPSPQTTQTQPPQPQQKEEWPAGLEEVVVNEPREAFKQTKIYSSLLNIMKHIS